MNTQNIDYDGIAQKLGGNWTEFSSFSWHDKPDDAIEHPKNWTIYYTAHRDSDILAQANRQAIDAIMSQFVDNETVFTEYHNHWAVGYIEGYSIKIRDSAGDFTLGFKAIAEIVTRLDNYPILDEDLFSTMEFEAAIWNVKDALEWVINCDDLEVSVTEELIDKLYEWLYLEYPEDLEDPEYHSPDLDHIREWLKLTQNCAKQEE